MAEAKCYNEIHNYPYEISTCDVCGEQYKNYTPNQKGVCSEECFEIWQTNRHYNYYY